METGAWGAVRASPAQVVSARMQVRAVEIHLQRKVSKIQTELVDWADVDVLGSHAMSQLASLQGTGGVHDLPAYSSGLP